MDTSSTIAEQTAAKTAGTALRMNCVMAFARNGIFASTGIDSGSQMLFPSSEMEGAALYTVAAHYKKQALTVMTVAGGPYVKEQVLSSEEREQGLDNMILVGLKTLCEE